MAAKKRITIVLTTGQNRTEVRREVSLPFDVVTVTEYYSRHLAVYFEGQSPDNARRVASVRFSPDEGLVVRPRERVYVDGIEVDTPTRVRLRGGEILRSYDDTLQIGNVPAASGEELAFLSGLEQAPDDDDLRAVYADWLEENGRRAQAELLRLERTYVQAASNDNVVWQLSHRVRTAAADVPTEWRRRVCRLPIRCAEPWSSACPRWLHRASLASDGTRFCTRCNRDILQRKDRNESPSGPHVADPALDVPTTFRYTPPDGG